MLAQVPCNNIDNTMSSAQFSVCYSLSTRDTYALAWQERNSKPLCLLLLQYLLHTCQLMLVPARSNSLSRWDNSYCITCRLGHQIQDLIKRGG